MSGDIEVIDAVRSLVATRRPTESLWGILLDDGEGPKDNEVVDIEACARALLKRKKRVA